MKQALDQTFGYQQVETEQREQLIRQVFDSVAPRYDLMNDAMSFGIHRLWKRKMATIAEPKAGQFIVDLAGGTGDIARLLSKSDRTVIIADPSRPMMKAGMNQAPENVGFVACTGEQISLADNSVDTLTIAFGIRNMTHMEQALQEIVRVLKPGGRCLCLEFSRPHALIKPFYDLYSFLVIPRLGAWIARQPSAYQYLIESIRRFPDQKKMQSLMEEAGMIDVGYKNLSFGIACLHVGEKPG
ncbi:MAG: class I SAM-dependent methyltransferase [Gammaproteobacteria bacterium]|nr:MAG: class I SAM-dependent methyltransferase [Gammaproteobacteria bacterium]